MSFRVACTQLSHASTQSSNSNGTLRQGFDNPGKSLYTTIRELVENSLDACESVDVLPEISLHIEEMTEAMFNELRGVPDDTATTIGKNNEGEDGTKKKRSKFDAYFQITVRDNGCGMAHGAIPDLLGRVLSGSKYGVRQTRGKFGLGERNEVVSVIYDYVLHWALLAFGSFTALSTADITTSFSLFVLQEPKWH